MEYFKSPSTEKFNKEFYRNKVKLLEKKSKRNRVVRKILISLDFVLLFLVVTAMVLLTEYLGTLKSLNAVLIFFLQFLVSGLSMALAIIIFFLIVILIANIFPDMDAMQIHKTIVGECLSAIKDYYNIGDNFIKTKCYESSNPDFTDRDLILFIYNDNLRIVNDFTTTIRDIGCYEIPKNELEYGYGKKDKLTTTVVKCKELSLILGKRAKPFITKNIGSP